MSPHGSSLLLICLIMGLGLCQSATLAKLRITRDTRNIPSNMFKPVNGASSLGNQNTSAVAQDDYAENSFSQQSTGEAHAITSPIAQGRRKFYPEPRPQEEDYEDPLPFRPNTSPFRNSNRSFSSGPSTNNFESSFNRESSSSFSGPAFIHPEFGSIRPFSQTIPLMSTGIGPSFRTSGFPDSNFGRSGSNNFFRSESYSYNSDGNGPPQVERNVFDSRLGHGMSDRNF